MEHIPKTRIITSNQKHLYSVVREANIAKKNHTHNKHLYASEDESIKNKIKYYSEQIKKVREQNKQLKKTNTELLSEQYRLNEKCNQIIKMFPMNNNNISTFPNQNALSAELNTFINVDLFKFYNDVLSDKKFYIKSLRYFFPLLFQYSQKKIDDHFKDFNTKLPQFMKCSVNDEPLEWIVKRSCQTNIQNIYDDIEKKSSSSKTAIEINEKLNIEMTSQIRQMQTICNKILKLLLKCFVSTPKINVDIESIGKEIKFDINTHFCFDRINFKSLDRNNKVIVVVPLFYVVNKSEDSKGNLIEHKEDIVDMKVLPI